MLAFERTAANEGTYKPLEDCVFPWDYVLILQVEKPGSGVLMHRISIVGAEEAGLENVKLKNG
jgi:hypothetical protein